MHLLLASEHARSGVHTLPGKFSSNSFLLYQASSILRPYYLVSQDRHHHHTRQSTPANRKRPMKDV